MPTQAYDVSVLSPKLRHEEFILCVADTLNYLEQISDDIFLRIINRVKIYKDQVTAINKRVDVAQAKIDRLKSSKKAIQVFSSAKYPAADELEAYTSIFSGDKSCNEMKRTNIPVQSRPRVVDGRVMKERLAYHHITGKKSNKTDREEGLGKLPRGLKSTSSLLLFNTAENPYKKYVMLDPLSGAVTKTRTAIEDEEGQLGEAPTTITNREEIERAVADSYLYMPGLGEVPEIDVPAYLPDLPGVADDLSYRYIGNRAWHLKFHYNSKLQYLYITKHI